MFVGWLARSSRSSRSHRAAVCVHPAARWRPLWLPALTPSIRRVAATLEDSGVCMAPPLMYPVHGDHASALANMVQMDVGHGGSIRLRRQF